MSSIKLKMLFYSIITMMGVSAFGQEDPTLIVKPAKIIFDEDGGNKDITIDSDAASWTMTMVGGDNSDSDASWIVLKVGETVISSGYKGEVKEIITLSVGSYDEAGKERTATIYVTDGTNNKEISISQYGPDEISLEVSPAKISIPQEGGSKSFSVASNITWSATIAYEGSEKDWLTVENGSGTGDGTVTLTAGVYGGEQPRKAKVTVSGQGLSRTVEVTQLGDKIGLLLSPKYISFGTEGGSENMDVSSNDPDGWIAICSDEWLHIEGQQSYEGNNFKKLTITADKHTGDDSRFAVIIVKDKFGNKDSISVSQMGINSNYSVEPDYAKLFKDGGKTTIKLACNAGSWEVISNADWLTFNGKTLIRSYETNDLIEVDVNPNDGDSLRIDTIKIIWTNGDGERKDTSYVTIYQGGVADLKFTPDTTVHFEVAAASKQIKIEALEGSIWGRKNFTVDVEDGVTWLKKVSFVDDVAEAGNAKILNLEVEQNKQDTIRKTYVYVRFEDDYGNVNIFTLPVEQALNPIEPPMKIVFGGIEGQSFNTEELRKASVRIGATVGDNLKNIIEIDLDSDQKEKWNFSWRLGMDIGKDTIIKGDTFDFVPSKRCAYEVKLDAKYKYDEKIDSTYSFIIYPSPRKPLCLVKKGNGNSGIIIATLDSEFEKQYNDEYWVEFGSGLSEMESTKKRYAQIKNGVIPEDAWVRTKWTIDHILKCDGNIESLGRDTILYSDFAQLEKDGKSTKFYISGSHIEAHFDEPTSVNISILSTYGTLIRKVYYPHKTDYDEDVNLDGLPSGLYILNCEVGEEKIQQKIVIK